MDQNLPHTKTPLIGLKIVWGVVFLVVLAVTVLAIPARFQALILDPYGLNLPLEEVGISVRAFAVYAVIFNALVMLAFILIGALVFLGKPGDRTAMIASLALLLMGVALVPLIPSLYLIYPSWYIPIQVLRIAGLVMAVNFMYIFPNGRSIPAWTRFMGLAVLFSGLLLLWPGWRPPTVPIEIDQPADYLAFAFLLFWLGTGVYAQVYRYRAVSTPLERLQTKWVVLGFATTAVVFLGIFLPRALFPALRSGRNLAFYTLAEIPLALLALLFIPISIAISITRYHLWDIDLIIRRTLVYSSLTAALALIYFGSVVLLQGLVDAFLHLTTPLVTVLSTLAVAALFTPLRNRIQGFIDRRFYRRKYDTEKVLAAFSQTLRDEVDLDELKASFLGVVEETVQPETASLWLRDIRPTKDHL